MRPLQALGFVGAGAIAREICSVLPGKLTRPLQQVSFLVRPVDVPAFQADAERLVGTLADKVTLLTDLDAFLAAAPSLIVECAGHAALQSYGAAILAARIPLLCVSSGALSDAELARMLLEASIKHGTRLTVSAGALGGIDALLTARYSGLTRVAYTSRKPPLAWRDTPAETVCDLAALTSERCVFEGSAREAARLYPKNANVAATIALAGLGFEKTTVRIIADPAATENVHEIEAESAAVNLHLKIAGRPAPANPKTSLTTAYALAREILEPHTAIQLETAA